MPVVQIMESLPMIPSGDFEQGQQEGADGEGEDGIGKVLNHTLGLFLTSSGVCCARAMAMRISVTSLPDCGTDCTTARCDSDSGSSAS